MKILVTGASGYIGNALITHILHTSTAQIFGISRNPLSKTHPSYHHLSLDISKPGWTDSLPTQIDIVVHLAQSLNYRKFPEGTSDMVAVNIQATAELLNWAKISNVKHFIFSSTGNVYTSSEQPLKETDPCNPQSMYGATKYSAELLISQFRQFFHCTILRLFSVYGPNQQEKTIVNLLEKILNRETIELASGKGLVFTPIHIQDCIEVLFRMIQSPPQNPFEIFNVGGSETCSLADLIRYFGISASITHTDLHPMHLKADSTKLFHHLSYSPKVTLEEGLKALISSKNLTTKLNQ